MSHSITNFYLAENVSWIFICGEEHTATIFEEVLFAVVFLRIWLVRYKNQRFSLAETVDFQIHSEWFVDFLSVIWETWLVSSIHTMFWKEIIAKILNAVVDWNVSLSKTLVITVIQVLSDFPYGFILLVVGLQLVVKLQFKAKSNMNYMLLFDKKIWYHTLW